MKAAVVNAPGADPACADFPAPVLDEGRTLVELVGAGIHPIVRAMVRGDHYGAESIWPAVPGVDAVARTPDGTLVYTGWIKAPWGTMAERMAAPAQFGVPLPEGVDPLAVAAGLNPGLASWLPLTARAEELGPAGLGSVVVLGATGVAGRIAIESALALGAAAVVAVGRDAAELERVAAQHRGGHVATARVVADADADAAAIAAALDDSPPSIVLDFAWGPVAEAAFAALGRRGLGEDEADIHYVEIGDAAGAHAALPASLLRSRRIRVSGSGAGSGSVAQILRQLPTFMARIADGSVHVPYTAYPLSRVADAWSARDRTRAVVVPD